MADKQTSESLPKARGALCWQWLRCHRPTCRCMQGGPLHGPYLYAFFREGGRLRKRYIRKAEAAAAFAQYTAERADRQYQQRVLARSRERWQAATVLLREVERYDDA